ncbi:MAG: EF-hand domain-containing protein [Thermoanaerobaculia bacterium]
MRRPALYLPLLLISSLALAAPPKAQETKNPYLERFKQLDRNGDGYVSLAEWPLDPASFRIVDRDQDGRLSRSELLEPSTPRDRPEPYQVPRLEIRRERPRDQTFQGRSPESLWNPKATPRDQIRFEFLDRNHDNRLSRAEWTGLSATFDRLDVNRDGAITPNEWPR